MILILATTSIAVDCDIDIQRDSISILMGKYWVEEWQRFFCNFMVFNKYYDMEYKHSILLYFGQIRPPASPIQISGWGVNLNGYDYGTDLHCHI